MRMRWLGFLGLSLAFPLFLASAAPVQQALAQQAPAQQTRPQHALSLQGEPKYPADFKQLDYVDLKARKGGEVRFASVGGFDSLNPFIPKGDEAPGLRYVYEMLMTSPLDDLSAEYGLIAESVEVDPDLGWVIFNLRREARWADNAPITADDVVYSFQKIKADGDPQYQLYYANVAKVEALDPRRVKFSFSGPKNRELPQILGQLPIIQKAQWEKRDFARVSLDAWTGSGPYRIKEFEANRYIVYERRADWWAKDLPINKGRYNFDRIRFDLYRDTTVTLEAFKTGAYDYRSESTAQVWATGYDFPAVKDGLVIKAEVPHQRPAGIGGFIYNLRRDKFKDARLREALNYAFDFEWVNKNYFYGQYERPTSYFENSVFAAKGEPGPEELKHLEPLRAELPPRVFGPAFKPPVSDGSGADRANLRKARDLLSAAGYSVKDGALIAPDGKPFTFDILLVNPQFERIAAAWGKGLERLGIKISMRTIDSAQYQNRLRSFDFDVIYGGWPQSDSPGNEQRYFFTSQAADNPASRNFAGIRSPAIDKLVDDVIFAPDRPQLIEATRALDRALSWGFYLMPGWTLNRDRMAYWDIFGRPAATPANGVDIMAWWVDPAKDARIRAARK